MTIRIQRVYDLPPPSASTNFLVDRLWPRGISKESLPGVEWLKEVAPSNELRKWFAHDSQKWTEFVARYRDELDENQPAVKRLLDLCRQGKTITLLYGSADREHNQAVVLKSYLESRLR